MTPTIAVEDEERSKIVGLCVEFLGEEWNRVKRNEIVCKRLATGFANKSYYCSIKDCSTLETGKGNEFKEAIVRLFQSDTFQGFSKLKFSGQSAEAVIVNCLSEVGLAPKLLGVFDGGIILEYIPNKVASVEDLASLELSKALIRKLVKFHKQSIPISKKPNLLEIMQKMRLNSTKSEEVMKQFPLDYQNDMHTLLNFPMEQELEWLKAATPKVSQKVVFSHNDLHPNNILLKETFTSIDDRIVLIDYECCTYFYRGYDIAGFLRYRNLRIRREGEKIVGYIEKSEEGEAERVLMEEYLLESRKLNSRDVDPKYDNLERLEMEVAFFEFVLDVFSITLSLYCVCVSKLQLPLNMIVGFAANYFKRKKAFQRKYGNPVDW